MQNALQNPHYKKIWERMNWQIRHPEAKSLEEALEMEAKEDECYILQSENSNPQMHAVLEEIRGDYPFYDKFQILGRPIKLEDLLILCKVYAFGILRLVINSGNNAILLDEKDMYIPIDITKPLHEQTPETWEKISNLI